MDINVKVKKFYPDVQMPYKASVDSAGADLRAYFPEENGEKVEKIVLNPKQEICINTQLAFQLPKGTVMLAIPRSSSGIKKKLVLLNTIGVIDADYRGNVMLCVKNMGDEKIEILNGERIAQAIILPYLNAYYEEVDELDSTERGTGGIGSSGRV